MIYASVLIYRSSVVLNVGLWWWALHKSLNCHAQVCSWARYLVFVAFVYLHTICVWANVQADFSLPLSPMWEVLKSRELVQFFSWDNWSRVRGKMHMQIVKFDIRLAKLYVAVQILHQQAVKTQVSLDMCSDRPCFAWCQHGRLL